MSEARNYYTMFSKFLITNGTIEVDLLSLSSTTGLHLVTWEPSIAQPKSSSVWSDPALSDGGDPHTEALANVEEAMTFDVAAWNDPDLYKMVQDLRYLLREAKRYWMTGYQVDPVWIVRQGICEDNPGYSMVKAGLTPTDDDPFHDPVAPEFGSVAYIDWPMTLIREPLWRDVEPGDTECLPAYGSKEYCYPCHVEFDGDSGDITIPDVAAVQDLADNAMTVEAWVRADGYGLDNEGWIAAKYSSTGWLLILHGTVGLWAQIECAVTDSYARSFSLTPDGEWHHVAFTWDDSSYRHPRLWVDGKEADYADVQERSGAIVSDVGSVLTIGERLTGINTWEGGIGWSRISDIVRYDRDFTPPSRCRLPEDDGNTVGAWIGYECSGSTIVDHNDPTAGTLDGTLTSGTFDCDCWTLAGQIGDEGIGYLEYRNLDTVAQVTDDAALQDLADAAMTIDGWFRARFATSSGNLLIEKGQAGGAGWQVWITASGSLLVRIECAVTDAVSYASAAITWGEWQHWAITWDDASYTVARVWINGVEDTNTSTARNGAIVSDVGRDMYIGVRLGSANEFDGDIGWVRISDEVLWTSDFDDDLPERCELPVVDANTIWLGIQEGEGVVAYDHSGNDNHAALSALNWGKDCCGDIASVDVTEIKNAYVICDGADTIITYTDAAQIQDLHDAAMTVEAWIRADSAGESNQGHIIGKDANETLGWFVRMTATGFYAEIVCAVASGTVATTFVAAGVSFGEWLHIAVTWDDATYNYPRLWINGTEYSTTTNNRNGAVATDVGSDLVVANQQDLAATFDGDIGWVRVSPSILYTGTFTPPDRCTAWWDLVLGGVALLTIFDEHGEVALDYTPYYNHGIIADGDWGSSCAVEQDISCAYSLGASLPAEVSATCLEINYVINSHVRRQFTHMFIADWAGGAVWNYSGNLIGTEGEIILLPAAPAVNDRIFIGIASGHPAAQRMGNIVWDIATPAEDIDFAVRVLQTGGASQSVYATYHRDNTSTDPTTIVSPKDALSVEGINALVWTAGAWATPETINGILGYWLRYEVGALGGSPVVPIAASAPYTVTWPYVTVHTDDLGGDELLLIKATLHNQSDLDYQGYGSTTKLLVGSRELDRGEDFTAYLLCGSEELPPGQTNTAGTNAALNTNGTGDPNSPKSECRYTPVATPEALATRLTISLDSTLGPQFHGNYHCYARFGSFNGGTWQSRIAVRNGSSGQVLYGETVTHGNGLRFATFDLGSITLGEANPDTEFDQINIYWQAGRVTGGTYLELVDLFILPVDECSGIFDMLGTSSFLTPDYAELDSATFPREQIIAVVRDENDLQVGRMLANATILGLQPKRTQRLWFFSYGLDASSNELAYPYIMYTVGLERVQRYWSMRGDET